MFSVVDSIEDASRDGTWDSPLAVGESDGWRRFKVGHGLGRYVGALEDGSLVGG